MSSRRADAAPDQLPYIVRNARTRRTIVITTRALFVQYSRGNFAENYAIELGGIEHGPL